MNERITLPAQEWLGFDPERGDIHGYTSDQIRVITALIVKECFKAAMIESKGQMNPGWLMKRMKERVGVE
jgi:hypothetical protein